MVGTFSFCTLFLFFSVARITSFRIPQRYLATRTSTSQIYGASTSDFDAWITAQGCKKDDCRVTFQGKIDSKEVEALANNGINSGETLMSMPIGLAIDFNKVTKRVASVFNINTFSTKDVGLFALFLLMERKLGQASPYNAYIASLPTTTQGIFGWSKAEVLLLEKSTTKRIRREMDALDKDILWLKSLDNEKISTIANSDEDIASLFRWVVSIVRSRSIFLDGQRMLLPGMDAIAMDPFAENEPTLTSTGLFGGKIVKVQASKSYKKGDRVFMSFGPKSSAECLEDYGIVPTVAKLDCICEMEVEMTEDDRFMDEKVNIIEDNNRSARMKFDLVADPNVGVDPELLQFLRLKMIDSKDAFILEPCFANSVFYTMSKPFSKSNEQKVMEYILKFCDHQLLKFHESEVADKTSIPNDKLVLIEKLRKQEKWALEATKDIVQFELQNIQGPTDFREYYQERRLRELDLLRPLDESEVIATD